MKHKLELMEHIFNGGMIEMDGKTIDIVGLETLNGSIDFADLDKCTIYINEKDKLILELQATIEAFQSQVKLLTKQKRKLATNHREAVEDNDRATKQDKLSIVYRAHLAYLEVEEIEQIFTSNFRTKAETVSGGYGISLPVVSKIRRGHHVKSSSTYVAHLKQIGKWNEI